MPKKDKGVGPVLMGAALTSLPHLRQRGMPIKVIRGEAPYGYVDLPLIRMGMYRHKTAGILNFDQEFFDQAISNHKSTVSDYPAQLNHRHGEDYGTIAFMDHEDGGRLEQRDKWLHCIAPIVDQESLDLIEKAANGRWRFTSPEIDLNYYSNQIVRLSADNITELDEELTMPKKRTIKAGGIELVFLEDEDAGTLVLETEDGLDKLTKAFSSVSDQLQESKSKVTKLEADLEKVKTEAEELKVKLEKATADDSDDPLAGLPDEAKKYILKLEAEKDAIKAEREKERHVVMLQKAAFAVQKAKDYRDEKGYGHSPVFLSLFEKGLLLEDVGEGDGVIRLENDSDPAAIVTYYRNLLIELAETQPGVVKFEQRSTEDDKRPGQSNGVRYSKEDWEETKAEYARRHSWPEK